MSDDETLVAIRRHWSDSSGIGWVKLSSLENPHMDVKSGGYEGGFGVVAPRPFVHAYVWCDAIVRGAVGHSCMHGPPPHRIKVCIVKKDNPRKTYAPLRIAAEMARRHSAR